MDEYTYHWHREAPSGLRLIATAVVLTAGIAIGAVLGFVATKAFANASHAMTHAEEWRF